PAIAAPVRSALRPHGAGGTGEGTAECRRRRAAPRGVRSSPRAPDARGTARGRAARPIARCVGAPDARVRARSAPPRPGARPSLASAVHREEALVDGALVVEDR